MRSLEETIACMFDPSAWVLDPATGKTHELHLGTRDASLEQARKLLALLRDRLLSEEAVEAGADGLSRDQIDMSLSDLNDHMLNGYKANARACLLAALDRIESHDR